MRPFTVKESSQIQPELQEKQFFGDGALAANANPTPAGKGLRKIIQVLDDRVLVFDPADTNPMAKFQKSLLPGKKVKDMRYAFDHIFDENASQRDVYEQTSRPLLDGIFDGFNATVFAYGVSIGRGMFRAALTRPGYRLWKNTHDQWYHGRSWVDLPYI